MCGLAILAQQVIAKGHFKIKLKVSFNKTNLKIFVAALTTCLLTGAGVLLPEGDLPKHHAILKALVEKPWPVSFESNGESFHLVYYIAYYLFPALLCKATSIVYANYYLFIEALLGVFLSMKWLLRLVKNKNNLVLPIVVFLFFEGQDSLFIFIKLAVNYVIGKEGRFYEFVYDLTWQFSYYTFILRKFSVAFDLTFVPQQVLGTWVATALIVHEIKNTKSMAACIFYFSMTAIWSILGTIGLVPLLIAGLYKFKGKGLFTYTNIIGGLSIGLPVLIYFMSHLEVKESGFIWNLHENNYWFARVVSFIVFEFGFYAVIMHRVKMKSEWKELWIACLTGLICLSFYWLGTFNDLLMRASIPLNFVFVLCVLDFYYGIVYKFKKWILFVVLAGSSLSFFLMISKLHIDRIHEGLPRIENNEVFNEIDSENWFHRQYLGKADSFYGKYLSRKP
jgi:hypothetical protein